VKKIMGTMEALEKAFHAQWHLFFPLAVYIIDQVSVALRRYLFVCERRLRRACTEGREE
jgi:hypothetical protein